MNETVKDRLIAFIAYKGLSKNKFETICGLSRRYVSNISKSIQPEIIEKISLAFPELDMGWVLTGSGAMIKAPEQKPDTKPGLLIPDELVQMFNNMAASARAQEENIARLTAIVDRLTGGAVEPKKENAG